MNKFRHHYNQNWEIKQLQLINNDYYIVGIDSVTKIVPENDEQNLYFYIYRGDQLIVVNNNSVIKICY